MLPTLKLLEIARATAAAAIFLAAPPVLAHGSLSGPSTAQLVEELQEKTSSFESFGWPARGYFTPAPEALESYVAINKRMWEEHRFAWLFAPTIMTQFGTQAGPNNVTANYQHNAILYGEPFENTHFGTTSFVAHVLQVRQFGAVTGTKFSNALGINFQTSDSASDVDAIRGLYWRQDLPGDQLHFRVGQVELNDLLVGCSYACDDTSSFFSTPLSSNPARTMPGQGSGFIFGFDLGPNLSIEAGVADGNGDGSLNPSRPFHSVELAYAASIEVANLFPTQGDGIIKVSGYYVDPTKQGTPGALAATSGLVIQAEQDIGEVGLFAKFQAAFERVGSVRHTGAAGFVWKNPFAHDEDWLGIGFGYVYPAAANTRTEYTSEIFYRMQVTPLTQITAGTMLIAHPSDPTKNDLEGVFSLRVKAEF